MKTFIILLIVAGIMTSCSVLLIKKSNVEREYYWEYIVVQVGNCTNNSYGSYARCSVKLNDNRIVVVAAPVMIGQTVKMCGRQTDNVRYPC